MFVLRENDTFDWPVKAKAPKDGKRVPVNFMARFAILDNDMIQELVVDPETRDTKRFMERALIKYWDLEVQDNDGEPVTDDDTRNAMIIRSPLFLEALIDAYAAGVTNYKPKN